MLRSAFISFAASLVMGGACHAQEWIEWQLVVNEDPLSDQVTYSVFSQENRFSPAFAYLACNDERAVAAFSDGNVIFHRGNFPKVTVRFDDREPIELTITNSRRNPTFLVNFDRHVSAFAEGLRTASEIAFRIEDGRTHNFALTGAAEAMRELDANCAVPMVQSEP